MDARLTLRRSLAVLAIVAAPVLAGASGAAAQNGMLRVFPQDDAFKMPALRAIIDEILAGVDNRDLGRILPHVHPDLQFSFGMENGAEQWAAIMDGRAGEDYADWGQEMWWALGDALRLGGAFNSQFEYCVPYFNCSVDYDALPADVYDAFTTIFVIRHDAAIRAQPRADSQVIGRSSYEVWPHVDFVEPRPGDDAQLPWARVTLPTGTAGHIAPDDYRQWVGYRGYFAMTEDGWRLMSFIAGD